MNPQQLGSQTAKNGFKNEYDVCSKFVNWATDTEARLWLTIMGYNLNDIESVDAVVLHGHKTDVQIKVQIKLKNALDSQNIQVKLVSNKRGFNQVDKRWLQAYHQMWNMPPDVYQILQHYTGELPPSKPGTRDPRRMFMDEFSTQQQQAVLNWFRQNKALIMGDVIRGRGQLCAEWVLVAQRVKNNAKWILVNINDALNHYSQGDAQISPRGTLYLGRLTIQRKGGDGGRDTAKMLQFKLDPTELFGEE